MIVDCEGNVELDKNEQATVLEGLRMLSLFCESNLGCNGCPFDRGELLARSGVVRCELRSHPCAWDIPDKWEKRGKDKE